MCFSDVIFTLNNKLFHELTFFMSVCKVPVLCPKHFKWIISVNPQNSLRRQALSLFYTRTS